MCWRLGAKIEIKVGKIEMAKTQGAAHSSGRVKPGSGIDWVFHKKRKMPFLC